MDAIVSFFTGLGNFLVSVIDFVISFFSDLIYVIQLLGKVVFSLPSYFSWLPSGVSALLITLFAIVVIYKIIGREG